MTRTPGGDPAPRSRRARWLAVGICAVTALAILTGFEIRQRGRELGGVARLVDDPPGLRWELTPSTAGHNRHGFRGGDWPDRPADETPRVAVVGDSVTYGGPLPVDQAFPARTEARLRSDGIPVEVLNLGVLGYDLVQIQTLVEARVWALGPDLLVYAYFTNDHISTALLNVGQPPCAVPVGEFGISPALLPRWLGGGMLRHHSALYRKLEGARLIGQPPDTEARLHEARAEEIAARFDGAWTALREGASARGVPLVVLAIPAHVAAVAPSECEGRVGDDFCAIEERRVGEMLARAGADGVPAVDGLAAWRGAGGGPFFPPGDREDRLHPDRRGQDLLAEALAAALAEILTAPPAPPASDASPPGVPEPRS